MTPAEAEGYLCDISEGNLGVSWGTPRAPMPFKGWFRWCATGTHGQHLTPLEPWISTVREHQRETADAADSTRIHEGSVPCTSNTTTKILLTHGSPMRHTHHNCNVTNRDHPLLQMRLCVSSDRPLVSPTIRQAQSSSTSPAFGDKSVRRSLPRRTVHFGIQPLKLWGVGIWCWVIIVSVRLFDQMKDSILPNS